MESATLTVLLAQVRQLADVESFTARYPDAMLTTWINQGIVAYRELVGGKGSRVLRTHMSSSVPAGTTYISFAAVPFARIRAVFVSDDQTWYELRESTDREMGLHESTTRGRPDRWWFDGTVQYVYIFPPTDAARTVRTIYEPAVAALASGADTFQSLIQRGVEYVATFAALKLLARDQNQEGYTLLAAEMVKCEDSIKSRIRDLTGGTHRRRDTRAERERDLRIDSIYVWPDGW